MTKIFGAIAVSYPPVFFHIFLPLVNKCISMLCDNSLHDVRVQKDGKYYVDVIMARLRRLRCEVSYKKKGVVKNSCLTYNDLHSCVVHR